MEWPGMRIVTTQHILPHTASLLGKFFPNSSYEAKFTSQRVCVEVMNQFGRFRNRRHTLIHLRF